MLRLTNLPLEFDSKALGKDKTTFRVPNGLRLRGEAAGSLLKKAAHNKTKSKPQGLQFIPGMTCLQFHLKDFCKGVMDVLRCTPFGARR